MAYVLTIANYNYSSWSMRPWIVIRQVGIAVDERVLDLAGPGKSTPGVAEASPSGRVPVFEYDGHKVWESLAICELIAELFPSAQLWPRDRYKRANARAVATEMVAGFGALRSALPMNIRARRKHGALEPAVQNDIDRVKRLWTECLNVSGGPFLYGNFTVADAMYAPIVTRFRSYGVDVDATCKAYMKTMESLPAMKVWAERAQAETHRVPEYEQIAESLPPQE
jgi:glutathione S-transferase